jgi:hypothetical protein
LNLRVTQKSVSEKVRSGPKDAGTIRFRAGVIRTVFPGSIFILGPYRHLNWVVMSRVSTSALILIISFVGCARPLSAQTDVIPTTMNASSKLFLKEHCLECHSGADPAGGFNLENTPEHLGDAEVRDHWILLYDRLDRGEMPPQSEGQPDPNAKKAFLQDLSQVIAQAELAHRPTLLRRINRREYQNTVRDMFGIHIDLTRLLVDDSATQGFDTLASSLSVSAEQMVLYLEAADLVLDQVFGPTRPPKTIKTTLNFTKTKRGFDDSERILPDGIVLFSGAKRLPLYGMALPQVGEYRIRMKVRAEQTEEPVVMQVLGGNTGAIAPHTIGFYEVPPGRVKTIEFTDRNPERGDCLSFGLVGGYPWWRVDEKNYEGPGLFIGDIEIEGPLEAWPPAARGRLFKDVAPETGTIEDLRNLLNQHAAIAFRRPLNSEEVEPYVRLARQALDSGESFEQALRQGLKGILCAPEFLFLEERQASPMRVDDFAVAARLSYFLWSSLPDQELKALAEQGTLSHPEVMREQVERMLADPKSHRFVESFTGQWLRLDDIDFTVPDANLYPEYDQLLRQAMLGETRSFFREILDHDLSVNHFIDSDFAMLNAPLARFYGIDGVKGLSFRRVELPADSPRGGVLTHASVLKVSADGTRTSPVLRGAWILKNFYGTPPQPPPPTISAIDPDIRGATTIKEQLALHREHESCNVCHREIDPPGFALEGFDVIGAQRAWYRTRGQGKYVAIPRHPQAPGHHVQYRQGLDVDTSGNLADGREFHDISEYKKLLLEDSEAMPRALTRLLFSYSLGRPLGFSERIEVDRIINATAASEFGLRSLVHAVTQSDLFSRP